jgi:Domain of unknown function (DUF4129)
VLASLPPPDHAPSEAREAADEILARPEYRWSDGGDNVLERIAEWLADRLGDVTAPLGIGGGNLPVWVGWLVLALLVGLAALLIYRGRAGWRRDRTADDGDGRVVVAAGERAVDWQAEAARCEAEGRWREAVRARYRVLVGQLARRELIGDLEGRTAGELVADVRSTAPATAPAFARATDLFEVAWYGGADVGPAERDRFVEAADAVLSPAGHGAGRPAVPA